MTGPELAALCERHVTQTGMTRSAFGYEVSGDYGLIKRLERTAAPSAKMIAKVCSFVGAALPAGVEGAPTRPNQRQGAAAVEAARERSAAAAEAVKVADTPSAPVEQRSKRLGKAAAFAPTIRIRLYHSGLNGVSYVYGKPVSFSRDPKLLKSREQDKEAAIRSAECRGARLG